MKKIKVVILRNEDPYDHLPWIKACEVFKDKISYNTINLTTENWLQTVQNESPDYFFLKPSGKTSIFRTLYQERVDVLVNDLNYKAFPTFKELRIYENKRFFSYWVVANKIPLPETVVFYNEKETMDFLRSKPYPVVAKLNVGASGKGIKILENNRQAEQYIINIFKKGISPQTGPRLSKGKIGKRLIQKLTHPKELKNRINTYQEISSDKQKGFVILQEYIPHKFEWRVVRIGHSFFAHKKLISNQKASGSLLKNYENPPLDLFDFVKEITDHHHFFSQAVDIFETGRGYLVNEMQCIFGQSDPYQMLVDGKAGRYRFIDGEWVFEPGDFARNGCYDLRIEFVLDEFFRGR